MKTRLAAALTLTALAAPSVAHADPNDTDFVNALAARGLTCDTLQICGHSEDSSNLTALGKTICATLMNNGGDVTGAGKAVARGASIPSTDGIFIAEMSVRDYFPQFAR